MALYLTTYIDNFGEEASSFESDGMSLKIQLRNYTFFGKNFDCLEIQGSEQESLPGFTFDNDNSLTNCTFKINLPIKVKDNDEFPISYLNIEIVLENSMLPKTKSFSLSVNGKTFCLPSERGMSFETHMLQLQRLLPQKVKIHSCIFCAYSNYSVYGSDSFGTLLCYKSIKNKIVDVKNKDEYLDIGENNAVLIQETFWCSEFSEVAKGQWQYKDTI